MDTFLQQIQQANDHGLYYLALYSALAVPDICGALSAPDGKATRERYIKWFDKNIASQYKKIIGADLSQLSSEIIKNLPKRILDISGKQQIFLTGSDCYFYRCSALHQARSDHPRSSKSRIMFAEPGTRSRFHVSQFDDVLLIDILTFCENIVEAANKWIEHMRGTEPFDSNYAKVMKRHTDGLANFVSPPYTVIY